ncbi:hypothetical protein L9F63_007164, partial [Diploptera punctata]
RIKTLISINLTGVAVISASLPYSTVGLESSVTPKTNEICHKISLNFVDNYYARRGLWPERLALVLEAEIATLSI